MRIMFYYDRDWLSKI